MEVSAVAGDVSLRDRGASGDCEGNDYSGEEDKEEFAKDVHVRFLEAGFAADAGAPRQGKR